MKMYEDLSGKLIPIGERPCNAQMMPCVMVLRTPTGIKTKLRAQVARWELGYSEPINTTEIQQAMRENKKFLAIVRNNDLQP